MDLSKVVIERERKTAAREMKRRKLNLAMQKPLPPQKGKFQKMLDEVIAGPKKLPWEK
jgi:hypothetical protein